MPFTAEEVLTAAVCGTLEGEYRRTLSEEERAVVADMARELCAQTGALSCAKVRKMRAENDQQ